MAETPSLPAHFTLELSDIDHTGLQVVTVHDLRTGLTVRTALADPVRQVPAIMAFAGARYSRSAMSAEDLLAEINHGKKSAQEKLANIFVNYGHASVGDMAMLFGYLENVPRHIIMHFFNASAVGSGQERSSRYQDFTTSQGPNWGQLLPGNVTQSKKEDLVAKAEKLFRQAVSQYVAFLPIVTERYSTFFGLDAENKSHVSALQARVFDTVRAFLPLGARTSVAYSTSAREWARLIQWLKSDVSPEVVCLGEQLEMLYAPPVEVAQDKHYSPEAPDLVRHTKPDPRTQEMLRELETLADSLLKTVPRDETIKRHSQRVTAIPETASVTQKYLYFSLLCLRPKLTWAAFETWYKKQTPAQVKKLSTALMSSYTHHNHLPHWSRTSGSTFEVEMTISEAIDFNRHRAWGRFAPWLESDETQDFLTDGFITPAYLDVPALKDLRQEFIANLTAYQKELKAFAAELPAGTSPHFLRSLTVNAQRIRYFLSGGPKELSYMTQLRVRPGGHINYRMIAFELSKLAAAQDPLLSGAFLGSDRKPDPANSTEFFDRS